MTIQAFSAQCYITHLRPQFKHKRMKRFLTAILGVALYQISAAQITANDSVSLGAANAQMVFYKLSDGTKTTSSNTDWHLAITVRATQFPNAPLGGTTIRINEANGVKAIYVPNADAAAFNTVDTTGWQSWRKLHDSDTAIDEGALNSNRGANIFDFGWGTYNSGTHNVTGDSLYLIQLPNGELKKFLVVDLDKDTAFNLKYSNIDNSNLQTLKISKKDYQGKQFVYLNLLTDAVHDKEPLAANWDLQFLKYAANDVLPDTAYPVAGVWANKNAPVAEARGVNVLDNSYWNYTFSDNLNAIGWDWKTFNNQTFQYDIEDSLAYFVQTQAGNVYKVIFTGYSGSGSGVISFYTELVSGATGIYTEHEIEFSIYPNPAGSQLNIRTNADNSFKITIHDLSGRKLMEEIATNPVSTINISSLPKGVYTVTAYYNGLSKTKPVIVE